MAFKPLRNVAGVPAQKAANQYLTFTLGGELFGIAIGYIKEIIEYGEVSSVPMMPSVIRGVINLRGAVVPVLDLELRFGRAASTISKRSCIVILEREEKGRGDHEGEPEEPAQYLGMIVDAVNEVLEIPVENIEHAPRFGTSIRSELIQAMGKVDDKFVIILDVAEVLALDE
ncbi:MAG: purine-binding chemotaxis protein CheW, partial [Verrucomicrobia bacterium]